MSTIHRLGNYHWVHIKHLAERFHGYHESCQGTDVYDYMIVYVH